MAQEEIDRRFDRLVEAIRFQNEEAALNVTIELGKIVVGAVARIADALDHIARNIPAAK